MIKISSKDWEYEVVKCWRAYQFKTFQIALHCRAGGQTWQPSQYPTPGGLLILGGQRLYQPTKHGLSLRSSAAECESEDPQLG